MLISAKTVALFSTSQTRTQKAKKDSWEKF